VKANELLLWLSARREGSLRQYRAAFEELSANDDTQAVEATTSESTKFPEHVRLRLDLGRLAHVEFFARGCEEGWRVAPSTVVARSVGGEWQGLLCGARSDGLLQRAHEAAKSLRLEVSAGLDIPDVVRAWTHDEEGVRQFALAVGAIYESDAPFAMLQALPIVSPPSTSTPEAAFPLGADWTIEEFQVDRLGWVSCSRQEAESMNTSLLRFNIYFQRTRHFLRWMGRTYSVHRADGLYTLLRRRRRRVVHYDRSTQALSLPASCWPPLLVERALVLCSGFPPTFDAEDAQLTYSAVPEDVAHVAVQLLRQDFA